MAAPKKAPSVGFPTDAHKDERYEALADFAQLANRFEAIGRMHALLSWCVDRGLADAPEDSDGYVVSDPVVRRFLGPKGVEGILADGCDELALGELREDGRIYLRDTSDLVAWRRKQAASAKAGGDARASGPRDAAGRFVGQGTKEGVSESRTNGVVSVPQHTNTQPPLQPESSGPPAEIQPLPSSLFPDPDLRTLSRAGARAIPPGGMGDQARADRQALVTDAWRRVNAKRAELAAKHGWTDVMPLHPMDPGIREELPARILEAGADARAQVEHVLAVAFAEADHKPTVEYLTGAMFEARSWRKKLGMRIGDATRPDRAGPGRRGAIGSAAPRSDHGTEARDCNEVFG